MCNNLSHSKNFTFLLNFILVILLLPNISTAQFTFERTFINGGLNTQGRGCQLLSNGFAIAADVFPCGLCSKVTMFVHADSTGNILSASSFGLNYDSYTDFLHSCYDGNFIIAGTLQNMNTIEDDTYLIKYNEQGTFLWQKQFAADTMSSSMYPRSMVNTKDSATFLLYSVNASGIRYMKVGPNGDSLLAKKIGYPFLGASRMISLHDSSFAIFGYRDNGSNGPFAILKLDANGDTTRTFDFNLDSAGVITQFVETADYGFAILGNFNDSTRNYPLTIWKVDSLGNLLWRKSIVNNESVDFQRIWNCSDNGFIVAGGEYILSPNLQTLSTFLYRTNDTGDSLWYKNYQPQSEGRLYDVKQLPDNGFIAVGKVTIGFHEPALYILRTDSAGNISSTLTSPEIHFNNGLTLFPNPAHDNFTISLSDINSEYSFEMFDLFGRNVLRIPEVKNGQVISTAAFAKGFYNISLKSKSESFTAKLIIE